MIDYSKVVTPVVASVKPSGIRKYFDIAASMDNVISLSIGEPDFVTPQHIIQAGIDSLLAGKTAYTANYGLMELRKEIARYLDTRFQVSYDPAQEVLVTVGGSEAIDMCIRAFVGPDDEVLVPEPAFVCYAPLTTILGGKAVEIPTTKENSFKVQAEDIKAAITPRTKLLILSYPNNPTGAVLTKEEQLAIAKVLEGTNVVVISDEIYAELSYGFKHTSFASLPGMRERTVLVSGFSKAFAMTGWRLGYCCAPVELMQYVGRLHQYALMCASTPAQYAGLEALKNGMPDVEFMREKYNERRVLIYNGLKQLGFDVFEPKGAFYIFPNVKKFAPNGGEFVEGLLRSERVAVVPGDAFGECGKEHVRISYAASQEKIKEALVKIERFINS